MRPGGAAAALKSGLDLLHRTLLPSNLLLTHAMNEKPRRSRPSEPRRLRPWLSPLGGDVGRQLKIWIVV